MNRLCYLALCVAAAFASSEFEANQREPCFWSDLVSVDRRSPLELHCSGVAAPSSISFAVSSNSGYDDFQLLVLADSDYKLWRKSPGSALAKACVNAECDRVDAYAKIDIVALDASQGPFHVVLISHAVDPTTPAEFDVTVSISVGEPEVVGAVQLTGSTSSPTPPPPPPPPSAGGLGVDISAPICGQITTGNWQCLYGKNYTYAIVQAWAGGYQFNKNLANCVSIARGAGFTSIDLYAFACPNCAGNSDPTAMVEALMNGIKTAGVSYGTLWFDVEQCNGCWSTDLASNAQYVLTAVKHAVSLGANVGIYSSEGEWSQTVGSSTAFTQWPLWYAHYDGQPNFSDSSAYHFGGWTSPYRKQFAGTTSLCGTSVDLDWQPN